MQAKWCFTLRRVRRVIASDNLRNRRADCYLLIVLVLLLVVYLCQHTLNGQPLVDVPAAMCPSLSRHSMPTVSCDSSSLLEVSVLLSLLTV
jgi:hypothetical protein